MRLGDFEGNLNSRPSNSSINRLFVCRCILVNSLDSGRCRNASHYEKEPRDMCAWAARTVSTFPPAAGEAVGSCGGPWRTVGRWTKAPRHGMHCACARWIFIPFINCLPSALILTCLSYVEFQWHKLSLSRNRQFIHLRAAYGASRRWHLLTHNGMHHWRLAADISHLSIGISLVSSKYCSW